jgi:hypothetical protein
VIQELGREGILPYSSWFASNKPFNAPLAGMFTQYLVSCMFLFTVPPGDAYLFLISRKQSFLHTVLAILLRSLVLLQYPRILYRSLTLLWLLVLFFCIPAPTASGTGTLPSTRPRALSFYFWRPIYSSSSCPSSLLFLDLGHTKGFRIG